MVRKKERRAKALAAMDPANILSGDGGYLHLAANKENLDGREDDSI